MLQSLTNWALKLDSNCTKKPDCIFVAVNTKMQTYTELGHFWNMPFIVVIAGSICLLTTWKEEAGKCIIRGFFLNVNWRDTESNVGCQWLVIKCLAENLNAWPPVHYYEHSLKKIYSVNWWIFCLLSSCFMTKIKRLFSTKSFINLNAECLDQIMILSFDMSGLWSLCWTCDTRMGILEVWACARETKQKSASSELFLTRHSHVDFYSTGS